MKYRRLCVAICLAVHLLPFASAGAQESLLRKSYDRFKDETTVQTSFSVGAASVKGVKLGEFLIAFGYSHSGKVRKDHVPVIAFMIMFTSPLGKYDLGADVILLLDGTKRIALGTLKHGDLQVTKDDAGKLVYLDPMAAAITQEQFIAIAAADRVEMRIDNFEITWPAGSRVNMNQFFLDLKD